MHLSFAKRILMSYHFIRKKKKKLNYRVQFYNIVGEEKPETTIFHFWVHHSFFGLNWCS